MIAIIGLLILGTGIVSAIGVAAQFDDSPLPWFRSLCFILVMPCLIVGCLVTLIGFGMWLAQPHVWRF